MSEPVAEPVVEEETSGSKTGGNFTLVFLLPLLLYFFAVFKLYMTGINDDGTQSVNNPQTKISIVLLGFMVILFLMIYGFNMRDMAKTCPPNTKNFARNAFLATFTPFIFIMGSLVTVLMLMPGWKAPFSNTLGYFIVKNVWARKLFKLQEWVKIDESQGTDVTRPLQRFNQMGNRTFFLNELTPDNFFNGLATLNIGENKQFQFHSKEVDNPKEPGKKMANPKTDGVHIVKKLYGAVVLKDIVSEFIWYFIGGLLTYSVSQLYALDSYCETETVDNEFTKAYAKAEEMNEEMNEDDD